ncbi:MAG TPA: acetylornithine carbamoyltransferase [Bacteroidia bacterium]
MIKRFTSVQDIDNVVNCVDEVIELKNQTKTFESHKGKTLGLVFMNPSLRTRMSTQVAARKLGMEVLLMSVGADTWQIEFNDGAVMDGQNVEHIKDAAAVMGLYCDVIGLRSFPSLNDKESDSNEKIMESFMRYCNKPFLSLESATLHPLQSLADLMSIQETRQESGLNILLSWAPHVKPLPQAVANSFSEWVLAWGKHSYTIACPEGYDLDPKFTKGATIVRDPGELAGKADFVYFKNWSSFEQYGQMPEAKFDVFKKQHQFLETEAHFMHCLPVRRNLELIDEIIDSPRSLVLKQAENRVFAAMWALDHLLK